MTDYLPSQNEIITYGVVIARKTKSTFSNSYASKPRKRRQEFITKEKTPKIHNKGKALKVQVELHDLTPNLLRVRGLYPQMPSLLMVGQGVPLVS